MAEAGEAGDSETEARADIEFHETIFELTENCVLQQASSFVTTLLESSVRFGRRVILEGGYENERLLEQHRRIAEAISAGEPELARAAMERHMSLVFEYYLRADSRSDQQGDRRSEGRGGGEAGRHDERR